MALPTTLTGKFWKDHKGKTVSKTGLGGALDAYAKLREAVGKNFENQSLAAYPVLEKALLAVQNALAVAQKATAGVTHKASHAIVGAYQKLANQEEDILWEAKKAYQEALKKFEAAKRKAAAPADALRKTAASCLAAAEKAEKVIASQTALGRAREQAMDTIDKQVQDVAEAFDDMKKLLAKVDAVKASKNMHHEDVAFTGALTAHLGDVYGEIMEADRAINKIRSASFKALTGRS